MNSNIRVFKAITRFKHFWKPPRSPYNITLQILIYIISFQNACLKPGQVSISLQLYMYSLKIMQKTNSNGKYTHLAMPCSFQWHKVTFEGQYIARRFKDCLFHVCPDLYVHVHIHIASIYYGFCYSSQIAKKRSAHGFRGPSKPYRHLEFLSYSHIRSIVDFIDSEGLYILCF